jgi:hypothetical protein
MKIERFALELRSVFASCGTFWAKSSRFCLNCSESTHLPLEEVVPVAAHVSLREFVLVRMWVNGGSTKALFE